MPHEFKPDWCLAPAALLSEWMKEHSMSVTAMARAVVGHEYPRLGETSDQIWDVLSREPLTEEIAAVLAAGTGVAAPFWLAAERIYRQGLADGLSDTTQADLGR